MSGILLWIYIIVIICLLFTGQPSVFQSILLNFQLVLSLVMYIQGLSVIHFFGKAKGLPNAVTILLLIIGTILTPTTHIVGLLGVIDLSLNLKRIMKIILKVNRGGIMNRQSTKKALLIPFVIMIITAIVLMGVWFIFNSLIALIASIVLVVMIIVSIVLFRQAFNENG